jgi:hypothetical protein
VRKILDGHSGFSPATFTTLRLGNNRPRRQFTDR